MKSVMEFALRCSKMLARWLCPGADDDHAAIARRLGMLPDDTLPLWLAPDEPLSLVTGAQKATIARAEADRAEARGSLLTGFEVSDVKEKVII